MPTVLITGAGSGIGRDTARVFAHAGWRCVLVDRNDQALQQLVAELPVQSHILRAIDLTNAMQVASLEQGIPPLDAVINNAGMSDASNPALVDQRAAQLDRLLALNLAAPAAEGAACASHLVAGARIVNVSSGAGLNAIPWRGAYSPSKAGLIAQSQALAKSRPEWCVTVLAPGFVRTELVDSLIAAGRIQPQNAVAKIPLGRMAEPAEMAQALFFLASSAAGPLSGQVLAVNGGSSVYGGSQPFAPTAWQTLPLDLPLHLAVTGSDEPTWTALSRSANTADSYVGVLDVSPLKAPVGGLLTAVHAAAAAFAERHAHQASLTLLLPRAPSMENIAWQRAGDHAAARMLVATLACEWGVKALRVNAIVVPDDVNLKALRAVLNYVAGAAAQYLTGQTLSWQ